MNRLALSASFVMLAAVPAFAGYPTPWSQGFESDTTGWFDGLQGSDTYGTITRVTGPLSPFQGSAYATVVGDNDSAPFTRFGGYSDTFPYGGYKTSLAVYLDPGAMQLGDGFDYSTASNDAAGVNRRDFIIHVGKQANGDLLVAGSNNSNFATRMDLASINHYAVTSAGWYIMESAFRDNGSGVLAVDLNLRDASNTLLFTETRSDASDIIGTTVGGNRYGWFTFTTGTFSIDAASITPAPGGAALLGLGGVLGARRRRG